MNFSKIIIFYWKVKRTHFFDELFNNKKIRYELPGTCAWWAWVKIARRRRKFLENLPNIDIFDQFCPFFWFLSKSMPNLCQNLWNLWKSMQNSQIYAESMQKSQIYENLWNLCGWTPCNCSLFISLIKNN